MEWTLKIYFAGTEPKNYRVALKEQGVESILQSYWSLGGGGSNPKAPNNKDFDYYLLDSGGYSARIRGIEIDVKAYADYLNKHKIKYAFNLDTNSVPETLRNQKYLEQNTDTYIIPIYHLSDWLDPQHRGLIEKYAEAYPFIAVGGSAGAGGTAENRKKFLNHTFHYTKDKVKVHGLGMTTEWMLMGYPFYSVDSTSWMETARFGSSKVYDKSLATVRAKKRHYLERLPDEIQHWLKKEQTITDLWKRRGVVWNNVRKENG